MQKIVISRIREGISELNGLVGNWDVFRLDSKRIAFRIRLTLAYALAKGSVKVYVSGRQGKIAPVLAVLAGIRDASRSVFRAFVVGIRMPVDRNRASNRAVRCTIADDEGGIAGEKGGHVGVAEPKRSNTLLLVKAVATACCSRNRG